MRGRGYREYHLDDYSHWFRDAMEDKENWRRTRSCMVNNGVCKKLEESGNETYSQFFKSHLSPIEVIYFGSHLWPVRFHVLVSKCYFSTNFSKPYSMFKYA